MINEARSYSLLRDSDLIETGVEQTLSNHLKGDLNDSDNANLTRRLTLKPEELNKLYKKNH